MMYSYQFARRRGLKTSIANPFMFRWGERGGKYVIDIKCDTLIEQWLLDYRPELLEEFQTLVMKDFHRDRRDWRDRTLASLQLSGAFSWTDSKWADLYNEIVTWESKNR